MNKKKRKGFTLVELIVVMAIFSILLVGVMMLIDPIAKVMKRTNIQEANNAASDNMKRYFEGTLRYSDAIVVSIGDLKEYPAGGSVQFIDTTLTEEDRQKKAVMNFLEDYYTDRADSSNNPLTGTVRVMKINNDNGGKITESEFSFTAGYTYYSWDSSTSTFDIPTVVPATVTTVSVDQEVINDVYYKDYSYFITTGYNTLETIDGSAYGLPDPGASSYYSQIVPATYTDNMGNTAEYAFGPTMFSLTIVTYRQSDGRVTVTDDPATVEDESQMIVFKAPFASSNATMSLANITSAFTNGQKFYGPVRYNGWDGTYTTNYNPLSTMVDEKGSGVSAVSDGNWDYDILTGLEPNRCFVNDPTNTLGGNNIYFIYTLPNAE